MIEFKGEGMLNQCTVDHPRSY